MDGVIPTTNPVTPGKLAPLTPAMQACYHCAGVATSPEIERRVTMPRKVNFTKQISWKGTKMG